MVGAVLRETRAALGARRVRGGLPGHRIQPPRGRYRRNAPDETRAERRVRARVPRGNVRGRRRGGGGDVREPPDARGESGGKRREARRRRQIRGPHRVGVRASSRRASLRDAPPRARDARRPARRGVVHRHDGGWRKPSPNALVVPAVRGDVDGLRRRARAGRGRRGRACGELSAGPAASRRRREGHLVSGTDLSVRRRRRAAAAGGGRPSRGGARADSRVAERERPRREGLGSFRVGRVRRARRDATRRRPRVVFSQRASCVLVRRCARRKLSRDARFGRRASDVPGGAVSGKQSRARVRAARGGGGARIPRRAR